MQSNNSASWYLLGDENLCSHKKPSHRAALFIIAKNLENTKISFSGWMDKWTMAHPDDGILFGTKKKKKRVSKPWKGVVEP